jgi:serine protease
VSKSRRTKKAYKSRSYHVPKTLAVRFKVVELPYKDLTEKHFRENGLTNFAQLFEDFPGISVEPMIKSLSPKEIEELMATTSIHQHKNANYEPINFLLDYRVIVPNDINAESVLDSIQKIDYVDSAYIEAGPSPPPNINWENNPRANNQGYQMPAADGIDVRSIWNLPGGDGRGVNFIDIEQGWTLEHEDLIEKGIPEPSGRSGFNKQWYAHGTCVLGIVLGFDNTKGGVGIGPNVASARVVSTWRTRDSFNRVDAIAAASFMLGTGDILLIEDHRPYPINSTTYVPVEVEDRVYDAIRTAMMRGIIVVEAAGNSNVDLDTFTNNNGLQILNRSSTHFRDSGAIMVGAASSTPPHGRLSISRDTGSNYGSRIDCYAWGERIDTCGTVDPSRPNSRDRTEYTTDFGGTSGAVAIIAGAAISLQGIAKSFSSSSLLSPLQMRSILSDSALGTPSANPSIDKIGAMPNLLSIVRHLGFGPDIYIRDNLMDNGDSTNSGSLSMSPDIIVVPREVADPIASFGEGSGTENSLTLGSGVESGQDNFVYVRLKNRGVRSAQNVSVTIFWSDVASLVTPDMWQPIGTIHGVNVPEGNRLIVAGPLRWLSSDIPRTGHYCFIAVVDHALDPAPAAPNLIDFTNFEAYIRENNNVTWRNFNVVENVPPDVIPSPQFNGFVPLPFMIVGAPDQRRPMDIEIIRDLPHDAALILEAPPYLPELLRIPKYALEVDKKSGQSLIFLPFLRKTLFDSVNLDAKTKHPCRLWVKINDMKEKYQYSISVRQLYENIEVGRVTWVIQNPRK